MTQKQIMESLKALRQDAIDRGMDDLAIVYGWSAIRMGQEVLAAMMLETGTQVIYVEKPAYK